MQYILILLHMSTVGNSQSDSMQTTLQAIDPSAFTTTIQGERTGIYFLDNINGMRVSITNYGARVVAIEVPDRRGNLEDVVLGFDNIKDYSGALDQAFGAVVGRYANRIAGGRFELDGETHQLDQNDGENCLHSGGSSWMRRVWEVVSASPGHITLNLQDAEGVGGFPGNVLASVTYTLDENNTLRIVFNAETDAATPLNMTNHSYFNLGGECSGDVLDHVISIHAQEYTVVGDGLIPTGAISKVEGTALDLRESTVLATLLDPVHPELLQMNGLDHNFVVDHSIQNPEGLAHAASVVHPASGRTLDVWTSQPGIQLYTGNWIKQSIVGKCGEQYGPRVGFCLETQHYPDSPNHDNFPSSIATPDSPYHEVVEYRFGIE